MDLFVTQLQWLVFFSVHFWQSGLIGLMGPSKIFRYFLFFSEKYQSQKVFSGKSALNIFFWIYLIRKLGISKV